MLHNSICNKHFSSPRFLTFSLKQKSGAFCISRKEIKMYFMQNGRLREIEMLMQRVPNFRPRGCGVITIRITEIPPSTFAGVMMKTASAIRYYNRRFFDKRIVQHTHYFPSAVLKRTSQLRSRTGEIPVCGKITQTVRRTPCRWRRQAEVLKVLASSHRPSVEAKQTKLFREPSQPMRMPRPDGGEVKFL